MGITILKDLRFKESEKSIYKHSLSHQYPMSLHINRHTSLEQGINKSIKQLQDQIISTIRSEISVHEKIHEVRKALKKLRAIVRLVRQCTSNYSSENKFYRDLGRLVSEYRDKTAVLESLTRLNECYSDHLYNRTFNAFFNSLELERKNYFKNHYEIEKPLEQITNEIEKHKVEFTGFEVESFEDILPGIRKVYKRGARALKTVQTSATTENFHEWRKRTKYLRYQLEMLMTAWPHMITAWEESLHDLSDLLGDDHDYAVLSDKASELQESGFKSPKEYELFLALVQYQRQKKQKEAIILGSKIYLDPPQLFADRIKDFWKIEKN